MADELEEFKEMMTKSMKEVGQLHGGPSQYLRSMTHEQKCDFAKWLWRTFPERHDILYHDSRDIPSVQEDDLGSTPATHIHLTSLGFDNDCSLKPATGRELFCSLIEQYLQDGFVTASEPLLVVQSRPPISYENLPVLRSGVKGGALPTFSLGYLKGFARVSSLMALLFKVFELKVDLEKVHNKLYKSLLVVYVHHIVQGTKMDEALQNMKLSSRGSLRKMTNVIQMVMMIKNLYSYGLTDFSVFVRKWNLQSVRAHQIIGRRAVTLKLLFECAPSASGEER